MYFSLSQIEISKLKTIAGDLKWHNARAASFTWGKMRSAGRETAPQTALRDCNKVVGGEVNIQDFGEGTVHAIKYLSDKRFLPVTRS